MKVNGHEQTEKPTASVINDNEKQLGTVEGKIRAIAVGLGVNYEFNDWTKGNVDLDKVPTPCIVYIQPPAGRLNFDRGIAKDYPDCGIAFLDRTDHDDDAVVEDNVVERMKRLAMRFIDAMNNSGWFEHIEGDVPYQVPIDELDSINSGIFLQFTPKEKKGIPMCDAQFKR